MIRILLSILVGLGYVCALQTLHAQRHPRASSLLPPPTLTLDRLSLPQSDTISFSYCPVTTLVRPITAVFFDSMGVTIPSRYPLLSSYDQTLTVREDSLAPTAMGIMHRILDLIGLRLRNTPGAIVGVVGNCQPTEESIDISRARGEVVYRYLTEVWRIPQSQIVLMSPRLYPQLRKNPKGPEGRNENRRVEIVPVADSSGILWRPVIALQRRLQSSTYSTGFLVGIDTVRQRYLEFFHHGEVWTRLMIPSGNQGYISFQWGGELGGTLDEGDDELKVQLVAVSRKGEAARSQPLTIQLRYDRNRRCGDHDSLLAIVSSDIIETGDNDVGHVNRSTTIQRRIAVEYLRPYLESGLHMNVYGRVLWAGDRNRYQHITRQIAYDFCRPLHEFEPEQLHIEGLGGDAPFFDNSLPEGRILNHGVEIRVHTTQK